MFFYFFVLCSSMFTFATTHAFLSPHYLFMTPRNVYMSNYMHVFCLFLFLLFFFFALEMHVQAVV
jgi:hypothetical protein